MSIRQPGYLLLRRSIALRPHLAMGLLFLGQILDKYN
jgi:hypothetical protein